MFYPVGNAGFSVYISLLSRNTAYLAQKNQHEYDLWPGNRHSTDKSLLGSDYMYKVDPSEVWKTSKGYVRI
jgi:hypothetical protein